ncbi:unnamed protein product [Rotaria magnacalcarata]|uniref:U-box domain-containing protein n=1 Tax=Rotaria magnacalcarata TaxID=392030 RepID=A0A815HWU5_9BILA|nr:unnamed protein product [Rotaria magnacalcarata]CAF1650951.1 unnamed protein product [Rotaria magnacalcarata]CAF2118793.1 unnamed protein product [Rotaria magnacalcarata]CAF4104079.1 unnamed protein product [Rotaria magnacalcarata]CAF4112832.1 unnamed protein product [Rotaria magnacalcarata]
MKVARAQDESFDASYDLFDPITQELFRDPVTAEDGHVYERSTITKWITEYNGTSPFTRKPIDVNKLQPNDGIRELADRHRHLSVSYKRKSTGEDEVVSLPLAGLRPIPTNRNVEISRFFANARTSLSLTYTRCTSRFERCLTSFRSICCELSTLCEGFGLALLFGLCVFITIGIPVLTALAMKNNRHTWRKPSRLDNCIKQILPFSYGFSAPTLVAPTPNFTTIYRFPSVTWYRTHQNSTILFFSFKAVQNVYIDDVSLIGNGISRELLADGDFESGTLNMSRWVFCSPNGLSQASVVPRVSAASPGTGSFVFYSPASNETRYLWQILNVTDQSSTSLANLTFGIEAPQSTNLSTSQVLVRF